MSKQWVVRSNDHKEQRFDTKNRALEAFNDIVYELSSSGLLSRDEAISEYDVEMFLDEGEE